MSKTHTPPRHFAETRLIRYCPRCDDYNEINDCIDDGKRLHCPACTAPTIPAVLHISLATSLLDAPISPEDRIV